MTQTNTTKKCINTPHSGPEGCLPAPYILPLAKETFAKGKMFWNRWIVFTEFQVSIVLTWSEDEKKPTVKHL